MKKIILLTLAFTAFWSTASYGQIVNLDFSLGLPQGDFNENTDATGFGGDLSIGFPFQKSVPVYLGLDLNYMVYGVNAENIDLSAEVKDQNGAILASLPIPLRVVNTNSLFGTHLFVRAVAPLEAIQPYGEVLFGFRYISTSTRIEDRSDERRWAKDPDNSNLISRKTVLDDWVLSYGFGGGFMIKVAPNFFIDLRADYFRGQRAKFFDAKDTESWTVTITNLNGADPKSINGDNLNLESEPRESTTDLLNIKFGVAFKF